MMKYNHFLKLQVTEHHYKELLELIPGVLADIIFTKTYYIRNEDLKQFTTKILNEDYKDYLFVSRTPLYARVVKDIIRDEDKERVLKKIRNIKKFVLEESNKSDEIKNKDDVQKNKGKSAKDTVKDWSSIIFPRGNADD